MDDLQARLALAKGEYKTALKNLEMISDEIHERRRSCAMGPRGCGVGAEGSGAAEDLLGSKAEPDAVSGEQGWWAGKMVPLVPSATWATSASRKGKPEGVSGGFPHFVDHCVPLDAPECSTKSEVCGQ